MNVNHQHPERDNGRLDEPGIVSVNARGAARNDLGRKLLFIGVVLAFLLIGGVYSFNHWRSAQRAADAEAKAQSKVENKSAQVGMKRTFALPAAASAVGSPQPDSSTTRSSVEGLARSGDCKDLVVLDGAGKAIIGKDGQAIRIGCDGKVVVPAIDPRAAPGQLNTTGTSGATAGNAGGGKPNSRFGGDVLIQIPSAMQRISTAAPATPGAAPAAPLAPGGFFPGFPSDLGTATAQAAAPSGTANQRGGIGSLLTPTPTPKVTASLIGNRDMLLAKGAQIDCALTTKVVNEVSGFASCVLTSNMYSDNGKVLLLERGSEAQGEYAATVQQGQRRLFVLWGRIKTPKGVVIALDSPSADGLGTMGLDGYVDNRWWDRLGAAFLLSFVKDAISIEIARSSNGASTNAGAAAYQNSTRTGEQMADRILSSTINIQPTIYKNQGDRASIYVARDLDFSTVYDLKVN